MCFVAITSQTKRAIRVWSVDDRRTRRQRAPQQQLMKFFCLDDWNDCHRRNCDDQFNCLCRIYSNFTEAYEDHEDYEDYEDYKENGYDPFTNDSKCIDLSWLCDVTPDCSKGEDERDCVCSDDEFQCNVCGRDDECDDGIPFYQCIDESRIDNGRLDCWNENDEPRYLKVMQLFEHNQLHKFCILLFTSSPIFKNSHPNSNKLRVTSLFQL